MAPYYTFSRLFIKYDTGRRALDRCAENADAALRPFGGEHRNYPQGTYVRNPIGTEHSPRIGAQGCTIFVKLWQFEEDDSESVVVDTRTVNYPAGTWVRYPDGDRHEPFTKNEGAVLYVKTGHLPPAR